MEQENARLAALGALIADLYSQVIVGQQRIAQLEAALEAAQSASEQRGV